MCDKAHLHARRSNRTSGQASRRHLHQQRGKNLSQEQAEKYFKEPQPANEVSIPESPLGTYTPAEVLTEDEFEAAVELLREEEDRIKILRAEHEAELKRREEEFAAHIADMEAKVSQEQLRARQAIQQTKQLRISTLMERDQLDEVRAQVNSANRAAERERTRTERAERISQNHKKELLLSMARERALLEALKKSEADLLACRARTSQIQPD